MRRIRTVAVLPTLFTLGNLVCGFFAIAVASRIAAPDSIQVPVAAEIQFQRNPVGMVTQFNRTDPTHNAMLCGWLIFLAMIFDALDGHVARLTKASSDFGAQLDSLCDLVTFGVAPAILMVKLCPAVGYLHREGLWIIATTFAACAAMRLARFNVETGQDDDHMHFSGLPTPAAAAAVAGFGILFYTLRKESTSDSAVASLVNTSDVDLWIQHVLPLFTLLLALLMVSRIPYPHVVNQLFRGHRSFGHVVGVVFALVAVMLIRGWAVPILCCIFVLGPPLIYGLSLVQRWREEREPLF